MLRRQSYGIFRSTRILEKGIMNICVQKGWCRFLMTFTLMLGAYPNQRLNQQSEK
jgi:hypothetical protein